MVKSWEESVFKKYIYVYVYAYIEREIKWGQENETSVLRREHLQCFRPYYMSGVRTPQLMVHLESHGMWFPVGKRGAANRGMGGGGSWGLNDCGWFG